MSLLRELAIIMIIFYCGEWISHLSGILLPGNVIGMILLLLLLLFNVLKLSQIEKISTLFLNNLTLFFIPAGAGIIIHYHWLEGIVFPFLGINIVSTFLVMLITGYTIEMFQRKVQNGSDN